MRFDRPDDLPAPLEPAAQIQARNTEYNLDLIGRVTHLDEKGLVTTFPVEIPEGTVLFSIIDLRTMNATVRGLIRVRWQNETGELGGYRTLADFVDLNPDERRKILRLLGKSADSAGAPPSADEEGAPSSSPGYIPMSTLPTRQPRPPRAKWSPPKWLPRLSIGGLIWAVLGLIFYSIVLLGLIALFPQGRAWELSLYERVLHQVFHLWPGLHRLFGLL